MSNRTFYASTYVVADGVTRTWPFSFAGVNTGQESGTTPYLYPEDVKVQEIYTAADGTKQTVQRTGAILLPNQITIDGPAVIAGREIRIYRETELRFPLVDYRDLQSVSEHDLDLANRQAVFIAQETRDAASANLLYDAQGHYNAGGRRIVNLAPGIDGKDAVNMDQYRRTIRVPEADGIPPISSAADRAGKLLAFDSLGNPVAVFPTPGTATALEGRLRDAINAANGVSILGYQGNTLREFLDRLQEKLDPSNDAFMLGLHRSIRSFGAKGNDEDDTVAIDAAEEWLSLSTNLRPRHLVIDIPVRYTKPNKLGAIMTVGVSGWTIEWTGGGKLVMDNLVNGRGTGGGIFASGPGSNLTLVNPTIHWKTRPIARSNGDAYMFKGHPTHELCLDNVRVLGRSHMVNAPQTGGIFLGCKDPFVQAHLSIDSWADNLHLNACYRPVVLHNYGVRPGDDVMALVTYWHPTDVQGGGINWQRSRSPYAQPGLGDWNNTDGFITGVSADDARTNAVRLGGVHGCTIGPIKADGTTRGLICDSGIADGSQYKWSYVASRKIRVESITDSGGTIGAFFEVFNRALVLASDNPSLFMDADISVGTVTSRAATGYGARINGLNGVNIECIDSEGAALGGVLIQRTSNADIGKILGTDSVYIDHACQNLTFGDIECSTVTIATGEGPSKNLIFGDIKSTNALANAFYAAQVQGLTVQSITAKDFNSLEGTTNNSAMSLQACVGVHIRSLTADSKHANSKLMDIGGGNARVRGDDTRIDNFHSRLAREDAGISVQSGSVGPTNLMYKGKWRNGTTGAWTSVTQDTYA